MKKELSSLYTDADRSDWVRGPWDEEPDKITWVDDSSGYYCVIFRSTFGALYGNVGVPSSHPAYGRHYDELDIDIKVHGGLGFSGPNCVHSDTGGIDIWWFGFGCDLDCDLRPGWERFASAGITRVYKDVEFVTEQTNGLVSQLVQYPTRRNSTAYQASVKHDSWAKRLLGRWTSSL